MQVSSFNNVKYFLLLPSHHIHYRCVGASLPPPQVVDFVCQHELDTRCHSLPISRPVDTCMTYSKHSTIRLFSSSIYFTFACVSIVKPYWMQQSQNHACFISKNGIIVASTAYRIPGRSAKDGIIYKSTIIHLSCKSVQVSNVWCHMISNETRSYKIPCLIYFSVQFQIFSFKLAKRFCHHRKLVFCVKNQTIG